MNIEIHLFDPIGKSSFPLKDAVIVRDIESLTIQDSSLQLSSVVNISVPFALGFLFHNDTAYKYIKIIQQGEKDSEEKCIWWGKVNTIGMQSNIKKNTINIIGKSFSDTYKYAAVDHKPYKNTPVKKIFESNAYLICNDTTHGSKASVMTADDVVFVPKSSEDNPTIDSFVRTLGETVSDVLRKLRNKAFLYQFSTMYKGRPKIIVNTLPIVPDGEYGFDKDASYLKKGEVLKYTCVLNEPVQCSIDNLISLSVTADYTPYRDRIRIFVDEKKDIYSANPQLDEAPIDRTTKSGIKLPLAPWVPAIIDRQNLSRSEAEKVSKGLWNDINLRAPSFHLEIAGWKLFGVDVEVGRIIQFSFEVLSPYIDPTSTDQNKKIFNTFTLEDEEMIITDCVKHCSHQGYTATLTLVQKEAFLSERTKKKNKRAGLLTL